MLSKMLIDQKTQNKEKDALSAKEVNDRSSLSNGSELSDEYLRQQIGADAVLGRKSESAYVNEHSAHIAMFTSVVHINKAINEIGFTTYHVKLYVASPTILTGSTKNLLSFFTCGFGYAVDSMLVVNQSIAQVRQLQR